MSERLNSVCDQLCRLAMTLAGTCLVAITAIIAWQVFARYVLNNSPSWTEQAALLVLVWMIFIGGAAGVHQNFHLKLSILQDSLPPAGRQSLRVVTQALVAMFGIAMMLCGMGLAAATAQHELPALGISRSVTYLPVAISGALVTLFSLNRAVRIAQGREVAEAWN